MSLSQYLNICLSWTVEKTSDKRQKTKEKRKSRELGVERQGERATVLQALAEAHGP